MASTICLTCSEGAAHIRKHTLEIAALKAHHSGELALLKVTADTQRAQSIETETLRLEISELRGVLHLHNGGSKFPEPEASKPHHLQGG